ncbi:ribonuclease-III-like-domain-containing protein [Irpex rosettiformis]|uniref:Ribonuclease-III-like-domain-containing protein n=1 Tax=Irpex rosettiformis TaxID=378272 RepID=A0ACB8UKN9_9APHY|nr:ribonuclease-III-like-domain-containing protein [Irpex rosettiformis]
MYGLNLQRVVATHRYPAHITRSYSASPQQPTQKLDGSSNPQADILAHLPDLSELAAHLNTTFSPLQFPPELAARILTHQSHKHAAISSNTRLSFIGRRVLSTYLMLFLHSNPEINEGFDYELMTERALNTYTLGEYVGPKWGLPSVMKWRPVGLDEKFDVRDALRLGREASRSIGLYKVAGTTVEAVVGGVFHQFGGNTAHRLFHTRLLPHILLPGQPEGLHDAFHGHAYKICQQMGGLQASLEAPDSQDSSNR